MIRRAESQDIIGIMELIKESTQIMVKEQNPQWDENYPAVGDYLDDIKAKTLYVYEDDSQMAGVICINETEPSEYAPINWSQNHKAFIIHRMAVSPSHRGKSIGSSLLDFANTLVKQEGAGYLKTDTYSLNKAMNGLLQKKGYQLCGTMSFKGKPEKFNCYEKMF